MANTKKKKNNFNAKALVAVILLIAFAGTYIVSFISHNPSGRNDGNKMNTVITENSSAGAEIKEPQFVKEGELNFLDGKNRKTIRKISIEIADNDATREQGLMYRKSMSDTCGMLFLFPVSEPQNFWMHNTYIPLDIIYVNENREIISIARNCKPLSDTDIPSGKNSQYVVEVNAGFCDKSGIKEGDFVSF